MMKMLFAVIIMVSIGLSAESGERQTADTLIGPLPKISLDFETRSYTDWNNGHPVTTTKRKTFMTVENGVQRERVRALSTNLTDLVKPVPEAHSVMRQYRAAHITAYSLIAIGASVVGAGLGNLKKPDGSPNVTLPIIGCALIGASNIPFFAFKNHPKKAVRIYNNKRLR